MTTDVTDRPTPVQPADTAESLPNADGRYWMQRLPLDKLLTLETPCYVYAPDIVIARYRALRALLGTRLIVSLKANPETDLLIRCGHAFVDGIELASESELNVVLARITAPRYVNNPAMTEALMRAALATRCVITIDSETQAQRLLKARTPAPPGAGVLLRINAAECVPTLRARADQFGMVAEEAICAGRALRAAGYQVHGLHLFAGSYSFREHALTLADNAAALVERVEQGLGQPLRLLNLGGGFAENWHDDRELLRRYRERLADLSARYELVHESGRGIYADAGVFVTKVVATKRLYDRHIAVCDGGIAQNFLLGRTEGMLRKPAEPAHVALTPVAAANHERLPVVYAGSSCSQKDVIGQSPAPSQLPVPGDYCLYEKCGAYNHTYTLAPFLSLPRARVYLAD